MAILIANPIYDTAFKYLMEDLSIARELIQEIIHEEIIHLEPKPQETTVTLGEKEEHILGFTVYRLDYIAIIKTKEGEKKVLIELQKAKLSTDIMRFRKYLGEQYTKDSYPIISIYFLGYPFDESLPKVLEVTRVFKDRLKDKTIERKKNDFIDSLTHDTFIIQLRGLKTELRTRLEKVLSIFSQAAESFKEYVLNYDIPIEDELQKRVAERLRYAASDLEMRKKLDIEQDIWVGLQDLERQVLKQEEIIQEKEKIIEESKKELEESKKELEESKKELEESKKELEESKKELEESKKELEESKKELEDKNKALEEKEKALEEKNRLIQELLKKLNQS